MTNRLALALIVLIGGAVAYDLTQNDGQTSLFLAQKFTSLIKNLAFWR